MKILIITTCYPPDTAIAAVRPYMFAKYLKQYGHDVTVLRAGLLERAADKMFAGHDGIRVISYLGENCAAEQFERGEAQFAQQAVPARKKRFSFLPEALRSCLVKTCLTVASPYMFYRWLNKEYIQGRVEPLKKAVDSLAGEHFDLVFSTYGAIENIIGGEYAAETLGTKWFLDFRDPIEPSSPNAFGVPFLKRIQRNAVLKADICTAVSDGLAEHLSRQAGGKTVHTLYNGYEPTETSLGNFKPREGNLTFCYTGTIEWLQDFSPFFAAVCRLRDAGKIDMDKIRLHYAGKDFDYLKQQAEKYHVTDILVDHGYVSREEAARMQGEADVFTVLSWNTASQKGLLTGKFYEGIRAKKPILSILGGKVPYSELYCINEKYHYGFCYESCREKEQFQPLCDYLEGLYREKMATGTSQYAPDPELERVFRYDTLSKKLETLCLQVLGGKTGDPE